MTDKMSPDEIVTLIKEVAREIERLRGWLSYIEGNHADHREAASAALAGKPLPEGYRP